MKKIIFFSVIVFVSVMMALQCLAYAHSSGVSDIIFSWTPHKLDEDEPNDQRAERLEAFANVINNATSDRESRAALLVIALRESRIARYVVENRCSEGPRGEAECDNGRAIGPWQLHNSHNLAYDLDGQAKRAAAWWRYHRKRCGSIEGAFGGYATGNACITSLESKLRAEKFRQYVSRL